MPRGVSIVDAATLQGRLWTPAEFGADLQWWMDASDISTITISTGISEWRDKSFYGRHAVQATSAAQPSYIENYQNGKNAIGFNGSQFLDHVSAKAALNNRSAIIAAWLFQWGAISTSTAETLFTYGLFGGASSGTVRFRNASSVGNDIRYFIGSFDAEPTSAGAVIATSDPQFYNTNLNITSIKGEYSLGTFYASMYGSQIATDTYSPFGNTDNTDLPVNSCVIGAARSDGLAKVPNNSVLCEKIVCAKTSGVFSDYELEKLQGYLAWKWGLVDKMLPTHPFISRPPLIGD